MGMRLDVDTVKAGNVTFTAHEMILVKFKATGEQLPPDRAKHRINEKQMNSLGENSNLKPGANGQLTANVVAGDDLLICSIKGHYEAGMVATLRKKVRLGAGRGHFETSNDLMISALAEGLQVAFD